MQFSRDAFTKPSSRAFVLWVSVINFWIITSCLTLAFETIQDLTPTMAFWFRTIEYIAVIFFTLDYVGNIYYAENRIKYIVSFWGLVDLISILPTMLQIINLSILQSSKFIRSFRVLRVLRVLKMAKNTLHQAKDPSVEINPVWTNLKIYFTAFFSIIMICSSLLYYVEGSLYTSEAMHMGTTHMVEQGQEEAFVPTDPLTGIAIPEDKQFFTSIPATMWWCILAIMGYAEGIPVTIGGRVIAFITFMFGLILFGVLITIVGRTVMNLFFIEEKEHGHALTNKRVLLTQLMQNGWLDATTTDKLSQLSDDEVKRRFSNL
ncbi:MAG: hypothetical protein RLY90_709 [Pseudomonadota bacterium]|jgi:voltage-gated potassium channel